MKFHETPIPGSFLIEMEPSSDERGFFGRLFAAEEFEKRGLNGKILHINNSKSVHAKTLRGLHYQIPPFEETKLVRCLQGSIWDVVLDLREGSETLGKWFGETLTSENRKMLYVPEGCAHGFITLEANSEIIYFVSEVYSQAHERGVRYDDPAFNIAWPFAPEVISDRDKRHQYILHN